MIGSPDHFDAPHSSEVLAALFKKGGMSDEYRQAILENYQWQKDQEFRALFPSARVKASAEAPGPNRSISLEKLEEVSRLCGPGEERIIEGIASSPRANSHGYAVDPEGVEFELPLPLCLGHDTKRRIGWVVAAEVNPTGISFRARIANSDLFHEADDAWRRIVSGALPCVSTGFSDIGDWRTDRVDVDKVARRWKWKELTVAERGANTDAKILLVKSIRLGVETIHRDGPAPAPASAAAAGKAAVEAVDVAALAQRITALEERMGTMVSADVSELQRRVAEIEAGPTRERLQTIEERIVRAELRCAAVSMLVTGGTGGKERLAEMEALLARIAELEARPKMMKYSGVWEARQHNVGEFVTCGGSVWYCRQTASAIDKPGTSACWQLAVKRGADGKDAR